MKKVIYALVLLSSAVLAGADRPYLNAALQAAQWISTAGIRTANGMAWPADPRDPKSLTTTLYSGTSGVVLFFLQAYRVTGDRAYLNSASSGADHLIASLSEQKGAGLYEGIAGIGFTLSEIFKDTGDKKYQQAALKCVDWIREHAVQKGQGVEWGDSTDIISGSAGTGLFLLYASRELKSAQARDLAVKAGRRLLELARPENGGLKWAMSAAYPNLMPNFSHGTAGIAYFLATLYQESKEPSFLRGALAGARYLQSIADTEGESCLIFHDEPTGKNLYYLGWCHGPAGTGRLFYRLYQATGDPQWRNWFEKCARSLLRSGIPEKQTPGFWNNVSQCCGSAGIADFCLDAYRVTHDARYLTFVKRMTSDLLARGTKDEDGLRWIQAEHRVRPELLVAQTGLMQGASGIGMWLLRLDSFEQGKKTWITMPDSPF